MGLSHPRFVNWAAQDGRVDDLVFHLKRAGKGALSPLALSPKKRAPIHSAAIRGHSQCVKVLYDAGSSLEVADSDGHTPLHLAASNQHYHTVRLLLTLGACPNSTTRFNVTPLHLATAVGHTPCMELLLASGALINAQESWGQTALSIATLGGRLVAMKTLLRHGADPEIKDFQHSQTALHIACASKDEERVLVLLDANCNVHAVDGEGRSPLGVALLNKFYRVVPLLLEYGACLNSREREGVGNPLLHYLDQQREEPLPLSRLCRVAVRKSLGPDQLSTADLTTLKLSPSIQNFLSAMLDLCEGEEVRRKAVDGVTVFRPMSIQE